MSKSELFNPFQLKGKTVLITGATSGIGHQCVVDCIRSGAEVIGVGRNKASLESLSTKYGASFVPGNLDLTDPGSISELTELLRRDYQRIDGIVHSAGISTTLPFKVSSARKSEKYYATNVSGPLELTRHLIGKNGPLTDGGSIIFITSVMSTVGEAGKVIYSTTKGALLSASKSLAIEYANRRIRFNCVSPGVVKTPMSESAVYNRDKDSLAKIEGRHPLGLGGPEDISMACIYLLSDASRWVTGSNLIIDGGYTAR